MINSEQLVDLPDLERRRELLAEAEQVALGERGRADEAGESAVRCALGGNTTAGGEAACCFFDGKGGERKKR